MQWKRTQSGPTGAAPKRNPQTAREMEEGEGEGRAASLSIRRPHFSALARKCENIMIGWARSCSAGGRREVGYKAEIGPRFSAKTAMRDK